MKNDLSASLPVGLLCDELDCQHGSGGDGQGFSISIGNGGLGHEILVSSFIKIHCTICDHSLAASFSRMAVSTNVNKRLQVELRFMCGSSRWKKCAAANCLRPASCRGLRDAHYRRAKRGSTSEVPLSRRRLSYVDTSGMEQLVTHLDLCTGIGGFHLAAEWAGFETIGFAEIEPYCCRRLAQKWPEIKNYGDLRNADFSGLRGIVTVCSAGVPCQPASCAGKRRGARDDRWLWPAVLDVVRDVQPAWAIFENPAGILTLDEFAGVLLRLGTFGYQVRGFSVSANAVGAKHRRQRVFIVAHAECERRDRRRSGWAEEIGCRSRDAAKRSGAESEALADADAARLEEHQSRQAEQCATLIGSGWPDGQNIAPDNLCQPEIHDSRLAAEILLQQSKAGLSALSPGQPESGVRRMVDGVPDWLDGTPMPNPLVEARQRISNRSHRLKALGNAVVPQQAYPFFAAIAQVETMNLTQLRKAAE